ncbi:MAG: histidine kinase [Bacteroidetes bacterium]|nr:histidine kinase [Bacteroidota bacterium]
MGTNERNKLVFTVKDRCRVCYTCVRECPVKAIKIINGQAEVLSERCIGCGNCVKVCSQDAKMYVDTKAKVKAMLASKSKVALCVAPSFPAEFTEIKDHREFVGMLKELGFNLVVEVSFGADIVAMQYAQHFDDPKAKACISSDCPAIVYYIEHYHPELVKDLAPIASPMVAMARIMREKYGEDTKIVFAGPCIAKKAESNEVDEAITFKELRSLIEEYGIRNKDIEWMDFDPPRAGKGAIFPVSHGLLQTANKSEDIAEGNIIVADGKQSFPEAIREFECGQLKDHHLELLCCEGCIMGPGMTDTNSKYAKRKNISDYVKEKLHNMDEKQWKSDIKAFKNLDYSQEFKAASRVLQTPTGAEIDAVLESIGKSKPSDHLNCGACGYDTCVEHAMAIIDGLAEDEMCLPYTIEKLHDSIDELNYSNEKLSKAQQALKQSEKLASMGQLSAGIAHELNNPLGVITMYSNILKEEVMEDDPMRQDLDLIVDQAERCRKIVGGLLNFARKNQVNQSETNINNFVKASIDSIIKPENVEVSFKSNLKDPIVHIDTDQMMQVLTNLEKNAVDAMPNGGQLNISLAGSDEQIEIRVSDTGIGIAKENMEKIFTPFFTTKELGKGTGLGLPLIYGIVKMHKGKIDIQSNADKTQGPTGTTFIIKIPRS